MLADPTERVGVISTRDAKLHYFQTRYDRSTGARKVVALFIHVFLIHNINLLKVIAKKELESELAMRLNIENSVAALVEQTGHALETLMASIATPVTEDWDCFKSSIEHFNQHCVRLGE